MRDVDEGDADLVLDALELQLHLLAELEVERAERLVEQEHARTVDEGAGERDPLLLAAGELARLPPLEAGEGHELERIRRHACSRSAPCTPRRLRPKATLSWIDQVREERVALEDGVDVALVRAAAP